MNEYEDLRNSGLVGFTHAYLMQCHKKQKRHGEIDIQIFTKLVKLDSKIGTTASEQLFWLLHYSLRFDLLKVAIKFRVMQLKSF